MSKSKIKEFNLQIGKGLREQMNDINTVTLPTRSEKELIEHLEQIVKEYVEYRKKQKGFIYRRLR